MASYDHLERAFDRAGSQYQADPPWWEGQRMRTPELQFPPLPTVQEPEPLDYETSVQRLNMIDQALKASEQEALQLATDPYGSSSDSLLIQLGIPTLASNPSGLPEANGQEAPQLADDSLAGPRHEIDLAIQETEPADLSSMIHASQEQPIAGGLEAILQQPMAEPPDPFDQQQRLLDMQMPQIMDPFGPMM